MSGVVSMHGNQLLTFGSTIFSLDNLSNKYLLPAQDAFCLPNFGSSCKLILQVALLFQEYTRSFFFLNCHSMIVRCFLEFYTPRIKLQFEQLLWIWCYHCRIRVSPVMLHLICCSNRSSRPREKLPLMRYVGAGQCSEIEESHKLLEDWHEHEAYVCIQSLC